MNIPLRARMTAKPNGPARIFLVDFAGLNAQERRSLIESLLNCSKFRAALWVIISKWRHEAVKKLKIHSKLLSSQVTIMSL